MEEKKGPGRPAHVPTDETRAVVRAMAAIGVPQKVIAEAIKIGATALREHYREELDHGAEEANQTVAKFLFNAASGQALQPVAGKPTGAKYADCIRAAIFWMKTRGGWRELAGLEVTTPKDPLGLEDMSEEELRKEAEARGIPLAIFER